MLHHRVIAPALVALACWNATPAWAQHRGGGGHAAHAAPAPHVVHAAPAHVAHAAPAHVSRAAPVHAGGAGAWRADRGFAVGERGNGIRNWARRDYGNYGYYGGVGAYPGGIGSAWYPGYGGYGYGGYGYPGYADYGYGYTGNYDTSNLNAPYTVNNFVSPDVGSAPSAAAAQVTVAVPVPDAQVWFNGVAMSDTGTAREFVTPPLVPGMTYTYDIRARWMQNGTAVDRTQHVTVEAGGQFTVDFTNPGQ